MNDDISPNQRIARLMGWQNVRNDGEGNYYPADDGPFWRNPFGYANRTVAPPDYFSPDLPIRIRLEMLEKLTEEQIFEFVKACKKSEGNWWSASDFAALMAIDQPTFASTWLRVIQFAFADMEQHTSAEKACISELRSLFKK
jgi:hypothetical protein